MDPIIWQQNRIVINPTKIGPGQRKSKFTPKHRKLQFQEFLPPPQKWLISFEYGHWQAVLGVGVGWGNLEWSPWFVVKFWGRRKKLKILRFGNLLPTWHCRAATTKPRQIERSSFFLLDHKGKTRIYRVVSGSCDVWLRRKRDSPMEEDDCAPPSRVN